MTPSDEEVQLEQSLVQILGTKKHELEYEVMVLRQENLKLKQTIAAMQSILDGGIF